ncbi:hypothetical protein DCCM_3272 [Desulfocucumis palustris]|uniref:Uncharacterized protein n=1 Tax=Desulfocucumis palustris TaxID=1898651 RepID=A0A2L2XDC3_9FIRM|nr:hypothetical protein [Desulfocucumis palustris]GBF34160.1 hypothetical protein DCCM_3272 [Desulfocucumis palustris]
MQPIPTGGYSKGIYIGYQLGKIRVKTENGIEILSLDSDMKRKFKNMNIKNGYYINVHYYQEINEGGGVSNIKHVRSIEIINFPAEKSTS